MSVRYKSLFVLAVLAAAIVYIVPTFRAYWFGGDPRAIRNKVNLGLDLQGGMYLDVEVDTEAAMRRVLDNLATQLVDAMLEKLTDYLRAERVGDTVEVQLPPGETVKWDEEPYERFLVSFKHEDLGAGRVRFSLKTEEIDRIKVGAVNQALEVIRNRIDSLGVTEPAIQRQGENSILIQLPGLKDRDQAIAAIGTQAVLEFYLVEDNVSQATMDHARQIVKYEEKRDPVSHKVLRQEAFVLEKRPIMTGETIRDARVAISPSDNQPHVSVSFDSLGADRFAKITTKNRGRRLAIVLAKHEPPPLAIQLVYPTTRLLSAKTRAFVDLAVTTCKWRFVDL